MADGALPTNVAAFPRRPRDIARARDGQDIFQPVRTCVGCGCTDARACPGGCTWVHPQADFCSSCAGHSLASWDVFRCDALDDAGRPQTHALLMAMVHGGEAGHIVGQLLAGISSRGAFAEGDDALRLYLLAAGDIIDALGAPGRYAGLGETILRHLEDRS